MMRYTVKITDKALMDMEDIYKYIAEQLHAPHNAISQYNRISEAIEKLDVFPERIAIIDSEPECNMGLRMMIVDNYSVFYVVEKDIVIVTRVLYSASDIRERLRNK